MQVSAQSFRGKLLGLTGYATAGKDEVADALVKDRGYVKLGWADNLYSMALKLNPKLETRRWWIFCIRRSLADIVDDYGWTEAKKIPSVREYLQWLGTEVVRDSLGEDAWVHSMSEQIKEHLRNGRNAVITNTRFENEARRIKELGGKLALVERPGVGPVNTHASDQGECFSMADAEIVNGGTLEALRLGAAAMHDALFPEEDELTAMISSFEETSRRAMASGVGLVLSVAAPNSDASEAWRSRHRIELESEEDSIDVLVDDEVAGTITIQEGVLTVDVFLAR